MITPEDALYIIGRLADWLKTLEPWLASLQAMSWQEIAAALLGVLGTALLAFNGRWAGWGFVAYLGSNAAWFWFALDHGHVGLLLQQVAFTVFSVWGIWKWLVQPLLTRVGGWLDNCMDWGDPQ